MAISAVPLHCCTGSYRRQMPLAL